jgi:acetyl-CoA acetyltransferase
MDNVLIAGVGIHPFGRFDQTYRAIGAVAARDALTDAGLTLGDLDMVLVSNVGAEMAKGQNIIELLGRPGIPIFNIEAACASSAGSLKMAAGLIESRAAEAVMCLGVEKAPKGFIAGAGFEQWQIESGLGISPIYFAIAAQELLETTDATMADLADISVKNHRHAVDNPNAMFRKEVTREEVLASREVCPPLNLPGNVA